MAGVPVPPTALSARRIEPFTHRLRHRLRVVRSSVKSYPIPLNYRILNSVPYYGVKGCFGSGFVEHDRTQSTQIPLLHGPFTRVGVPENRLRLKTQVKVTAPPTSGNGTISGMLAAGIFERNAEYENSRPNN
jgi:hypothetical protein